MRLRRLVVALAVAAICLVGVTAGTAAAQPAEPFRLDTGTFVHDSERDGYGKLFIENGNDADGVAVLTTLDERIVFAVYVQAGDRFTVEGIPDGVYRLYALIGWDWDGYEEKFVQELERYRFDQILTYVTTATTWKGYEVTLHKVRDGNAPTTPIGPGGIPGRP